MATSKKPAKSSYAKASKDKPKSKSILSILSEEAFEVISPIPDILYKKSPKKAEKPKKKSSGWFF